jgi:toxin HigB-1
MRGFARHPDHLGVPPWKGGRVVECAGLEIRCTGLQYRGFESLPFRHPCGRPKRASGAARRQRTKPPSAAVDRVSLRDTIGFVIKSFQHKGLKAFFERGSPAGIQAAHGPRLAAMLRRLNEASNPQGMNLPGWGLHPLKGRELKGHFSVWVSGNWRLTFRFEGQDVVLVNYQDYH